MPDNTGPNDLQHELRRITAAVRILLHDLERMALSPDVPPITGTDEPLDPIVLRRAATLTPRQLEFIRLACHPAEYTVRMIAKRMGITPSAVDKHTQEVYRKLGVRNRVSLLKAVQRYGVDRMVR